MGEGEFEDVPENCLMFSSTTNKCHYCEKGYEMNREDLCVKISTTFCKQGHFNPKIDFREKHVTNNLYLAFTQYLGGNLTGCIECTESNSVSVYF